MKKKSTIASLATLAGAITALAVSTAGAEEPRTIQACPAPQSLDYAYLAKLKADCRYDMDGMPQMALPKVCNSNEPILNSDPAGSVQFCTLKGQRGCAVLFNDVFVQGSDSPLGQNILVINLDSSIKKLYLH